MLLEILTIKTIKNIFKTQKNLEIPGENGLLKEPSDLGLHCLQITYKFVSSTARDKKGKCL